MRIPTISHLLERLEYCNPHARHAGDTLAFGTLPAARAMARHLSNPGTSFALRLPLRELARMTQYAYFFHATLVLAPI